MLDPVKRVSPEAVREVIESKTYEVGTAGAGSDPCLVLRARHQNPTAEPSASLLSTLWACDAAVGSQDDGSAKLIVGYDFEGAGIKNFKLATALPFSRLFLNEYPCLVKDVYLISMPWMLQKLLPLFRPLVSRRVRLIPVDKIEDFVKAVDYERVAQSGSSLATRIEQVVPRAANWLSSNADRWHPVQDNAQQHLSSKLAPQTQHLNSFLASATTVFSQLRSRIHGVNSQLAVP